MIIIINISRNIKSFQYFVHYYNTSNYILFVKNNLIIFLHLHFRTLKCINKSNSYVSKRFMHFTMTNLEYKKKIVN